MQPNLSSFPCTQFGSATREFSRSWYNKYTCIEYNEFKDVAYCFHCFLFKQPGRAEHLVLKSSPKADLKIGNMHLKA